VRRVRGRAVHQRRGVQGLQDVRSGHLVARRLTHLQTLRSRVLLRRRQQLLQPLVSRRGEPLGRAACPAHQRWAAWIANGAGWPADKAPPPPHPRVQ
jgi:hypothetical protein